LSKQRIPPKSSSSVPEGTEEGVDWLTLLADMDYILDEAV
jgi:hypothetical protein